MQTTWDHPTWGTFEYDGVAWNREIDVPAFVRFSYNENFPDTPPTEHQYELSFEVEEENELPSEKAIKLAETLLTNQIELVAKIAQALWDDFNGEEPDSGMWWHGELEEVMEGMDPELTLDGPDDILFLLHVSSIAILPNAGSYAEPIAEIRFNAAFEEEHGVGVLTDGNSIFGLGYAVSVTPFGE